MLNVQTPAARATDPQTSHDAAEHHTASGARTAQQAQVEKAVHTYPGRTSSELARDSGLDRYVVARRLPECETGRGIIRGTPRRCSISGRLAMTWWPVPVQAPLFPPASKETGR